MQPILRPFTPADHGALRVLCDAITPELPVSEGQRRDLDALCAARGAIERWVIAGPDGLVAWGQVIPDMFDADPGRRRIDVGVHPAWRGRGLGARMWEALEVCWPSTRPLRLQAECRSDVGIGEGFLVRRGFRVVARNRDSELDLKAWTPLPLPAVPEGVRVCTLADLVAEEGQEAVYPRLFDLILDVVRDVPGSEPERLDRDPAFLTRQLHREGFTAEGYLLAARGQTLVGLSNLRFTGDPEVLSTGLSGVRRSERRQGLARHLKLRALMWAKGTGAARLQTSNDVSNAAILAVNRGLGFVPVAEFAELERIVEGG